MLTLRSWHPQCHLSRNAQTLGWHKERLDWTSLRRSRVPRGRWPHTAGQTCSSSHLKHPAVMQVVQGCSSTTCAHTRNTNSLTHMYTRTHTHTGIKWYREWQCVMRRTYVHLASKNKHAHTLPCVYDTRWPRTQFTHTVQYRGGQTHCTLATWHLT